MKMFRLKHTVIFAVIIVVIALAALTAATYAWFSFVPYTNVTPMNGSVGGGDGSLLISNRPDGEFDVTCELVLESSASTLQPLSTADLRQFYSATAQTPSGISVRFADASGRVNDATLHGTVYLRSLDASHDVYFDRPGLDFGADTQALAAMRLGLRITTIAGTHTYIFALDDMGATANAAGQLTVASANSVVASVDQSGVAAFVPDPSVMLSRYWAEREDDQVIAGHEPLCRLATNETASVEYWLYLEGCDINCINEVQSRDLALQLAFSGVSLS